jgi:signal transduction histidine kinase
VRRQLALAAAALTSMIVLAFVVPLAVLVRTIAVDRATNAAEREATGLISTVGGVEDSETLARIVESTDARSPNDVSVFLGDGSVLGAQADADDAVLRARQGSSFVADAEGGRQVLVAVEVASGTTDVIRVFVPRSTLTAGVGAAWLLLGALGVGLVVISVVVADRLARSIVAPVGDLAGVAGRLERGDLAARVAPAGPPEIVEVGHAINLLADRINELLTAEREAVADLSHRLRTPVTALRLDVESLRHPEEAERLAADVDSLARAVDRLITEARRPVREGVRAESDLTLVARERVAFWEVLAEDQDREFTTSIPDGPCPVAVTRDDLEAALDALLGNVFAHTPEGTRFCVKVEEIDSGPALVVEDEGPGLPGAGAVERGRSGGGSTGLGLDIARRTAEAAGGRIVLANRDGGGARIELRFNAPKGAGDGGNGSTAAESRGRRRGRRTAGRQ